MKAALDRARTTVRMIQQDCEADAAALDGKPFTGKAVATIFGETLAMVSALAHVIDDLVDLLDRELT